MSNLSLYRIDQDIQTLLDNIELDGGELTQEQAHELHQLIEAKENKVIGCGYWIASQEDLIERELQKAKDHIEKVRAHENKVNRLKDFVKHIVAEDFEGKVTRDLFTVSVRKCPASVVIDNENDLPEKYIIETVVKKIDKISIKEDLKKDIDVPGARLDNSNTRLNIK